MKKPATIRAVLIWVVIALSAAAVQSSDAASLLPNGRQTFPKADGTTPCASCSVGFYTPGTVSPKDTWQDASKTTLNTNPVILDSLGSAVIYGVGSYRQIVCPTSTNPCSGSEIWDEVVADPASLNYSWAGLSGGSANAQTVTLDNFDLSDGQTVTFLAGATNTGATTLKVSSLGAKAVVRDTSSGPVALSGSEITTNNVVSVVYVAATEQFHIVTPTPLQSLDGALFVSGFITPTILAADQDDWTPTGGFSGANTCACPPPPTSRSRG